MKMRPEHFEYMKTQIECVLAAHNQDDCLVKQYETGQFPRADKVKDLQRRFCFDLHHMAGLTPWVCDNLYSYLNDDHIYTALRAICPRVTRHY